jgi:hypothetical protein
MKRPLLKSCRACGTEISRYSLFCRNCGQPQGPNLIVGLLIVFLFVLLSSYIALAIYYAVHGESFAVHWGL